jgi:hypothetical protein
MPYQESCHNAITRSLAVRGSRLSIAKFLASYHGMRYTGEGQTVSPQHRIFHLEGECTAAPRTTAPWSEGHL